MVLGLDVSIDNVSLCLITSFSSTRNFVSLDSDLNLRFEKTIHYNPVQRLPRF